MEVEETLDTEDSTDVLQRIFRLEKSFLVSDVNRVAFSSNNLCQIVALALKNSDLILWKLPNYEKHENDKPVLRWIPWNSGENKKIEAICFSTVTFETLGNGLSLLVITADCTMYILPAEKILNGETLSQLDTTEYSLTQSVPKIEVFSPSAAVWWSSLSTSHRSVAIVGSSDGQLVFYSLTKGCCLLTLNSSKNDPVSSLAVCDDHVANYTYLLVTNDLRQQWKLLLEKDVSGTPVLLLPFKEDHNLNAEIDATNYVHRVPVSQSPESVVTNSTSLPILNAGSKLNGSVTVVSGPSPQIASVHAPGAASMPSEHISAPHAHKKVTPYHVHKSLFQEFRQMSFDKINQFKHRFTDPLHRSVRHLSSENSHKTKKSEGVLFCDPLTGKPDSLNQKGGPHASSSFTLLQPCDCYGDAFLSVQSIQSKRVLTGLFISSSVFMLHLQNKQETKLVKHALNCSSSVTDVVVTSVFIYVADVVGTGHRVKVFSTHLSLAESANDIEYDPTCHIQTFSFEEGEQILRLFKAKLKVSKSAKVEATLEEINGAFCPNVKRRMLNRQSLIDADWADGCLVVTNKALYQIVLRDNPWEMAVEAYVKGGHKFSARYSRIFSMDFLYLSELTANRLIELDRHFEAAAFYAEPYWSPVKGVLKLATTGDMDSVSVWTNKLLTEVELRLSIAERAQISNFAMMSLIQLLAADTTDIYLIEQFREFMKKNNNFDEKSAFELMGRSRFCLGLKLMAQYRGLYVEVFDILYNLIVDDEAAEYRSLYLDDTFWELVSENCLVYAMVINPEKSIAVLKYCRNYMDKVPPQTLRKLWNSYDPTRPALLSYVASVMCPSEENHDLTTNESHDIAALTDGITTFLIAHINLFAKEGYDPSLMDKVSFLKEFSGRKSPTTLSCYEDVEVETSLFKCSPHLSAGYSHAAFVRHDGKVHTWGQALYGCLGNGPTTSYCCMPSPVSVFPQLVVTVSHVACGKYHSLALTDKGVYAWGFSNYGQLGIGEVDQSSYPQLIESLYPHQIVYINAGQYHSLAIDLSGRLWTWGWGVHGQLGHNSIEDEHYPRMVDALKNVEVVSAWGGQAHTVVLAKHGRILTFGSGIFGQLGIGVSTKKTTPVELFTITEEIVMISTGYFHSLAVSVTNKLYTWGINPQILSSREQMQKRKTRFQKKLDGISQPDLEKHESAMSDAKKERDSSKIFTSKLPGYLSQMSNSTPVEGALEVAVSNSLENTSVPETSMNLMTVSVAAKPVEASAGILTSESSLESSFEMSALDINQYYTPLIVDTSHVDGLIKQVSCGSYHSALLTEDGKVYTWGRNTSCQLGNGYKGEVDQPTLVNLKSGIPASASCSSSALSSACYDSGDGTNKPAVVGFAELDIMEISCGKDFTLALDKDGRVFGWGCNNSGQLGQMPLDDINSRSVTDNKVLFIGRSSTKRTIKLPPSLANNIETPMQIPAFVKVRSITDDTIAQKSPCRVSWLPQLCYTPFVYSKDATKEKVAQPIQPLSELLRRADENVISYNQLFHYIAEVFYPYYDIEAVDKVCRKLKKFQCSAKINTLCYKYAYALDASLRALSQECFDASNSSENVILFKKFKPGWTLEKFEPMPKAIFEKYLNFALHTFGDVKLHAIDDVKRTGLTTYLHEALSVWYSAALPLGNVEEVLSRYLERVAYPLSVLLFRDEDGKKNYPTEDMFDKHDCPKMLEMAREKDDMTYFPDLCKRNTLLELLSLQFCLNICIAVKDYILGCTDANLYKEFVDQLSKSISAPSVLKTDPGCANRLMYSVKCGISSHPTEDQSISFGRHYIHVPCSEMSANSANQTLIAFSCGHNYPTRDALRAEIEHMKAELGLLQFTFVKELVEKLFAINDTTCSYSSSCPRCVFNYVSNMVQDISRDYF